MGTDYSLAAADFFQNWDDADLITADDNWSGVASISGFRGDGLASASGGTNPAAVTGTSIVIDVNANRADPTPSPPAASPNSTVSPIMSWRYRAQARRAPYLAFYLDATGREDIVFSTRLRDIDTATNATQPIAVQYRIGEGGSWTTVASVANPNVGSDTNVSVTLPAAANNAANLQVRVITTDALGSDAFIGVDDISVTSSAIVTASPGVLSIGDGSVTEGDTGLTDISFTVVREGGSTGAVSAAYTIGFAGGTGSADAGDLAPGTPLTGTVSFADGETSRTITLQVVGDIAVEAERGVHRDAFSRDRRRHLRRRGSDRHNRERRRRGCHRHGVHQRNPLRQYGHRCRRGGGSRRCRRHQPRRLEPGLYNGNGGAAYATTALSGTYRRPGRRLSARRPSPPPAASRTARRMASRWSMPPARSSSSSPMRAA